MYVCVAREHSVFAEIGSSKMNGIDVCLENTTHDLRMSIVEIN